MEKLTVRLTFTEGVLGTSPANGDIYGDYIGSKAPDPTTITDEIEALGLDAVREKGMTIFPMENGKPFLYDYQVKGFFKGAAQALRKVPKTQSAGIKAFKKEIDTLIFISPRKITFENAEEMRECQRPLRASTPMGERVSIAVSEEIPAGASIEFTITDLSGGHMDAIREWLDYGEYSGIGQWRNSGKGRFTWQEI